MRGRRTHGTINMIAVSDGIFEGLENDAGYAFTSCETISRRVKWLALAVFGEDARFGVLNPFIDSEIGDV